MRRSLTRARFVVAQAKFFPVATAFGATESEEVLDFGDMDAGEYLGEVRVAYFDRAAALLMGARFDGRWTTGDGEVVD